MKTLYITLKAVLITLIVGASGLQSAYARPIQIPLGIAYGIEPNVMILLDSSGSMNQQIALDGGGQDTKINVAQNALATVMNDTDNVRFCLSTFGSNHSGAAMSPTLQCTSDRAEIDALVATVNGINPTGGTPLAEAYYDITRYFRGQPAYFGRFTNSSGNTTTYQSPIQYRCQANNVIVVTDGEPTVDWDHNGNAANTNINLGFENMNGKSLPNWDGIPANGTLADSTQPLPHYSDGYCGTTGANNTGNCTDSQGASLWWGTESRTVFLDDLAQFGYEKDMRSGGNDAAGESWDDPDYNDGKQSLKTYTIGFGFANNANPLVLADAAEYGQGSTHSANNQTSLITALKNAILTTAGGAGAGAGTTQSSFRFNDDGELILYLTNFDSEKWAGELGKVVVSQNLDYDSEEASFTATLGWSAAEHLDTKAPNTRNIFTYDPVTDNVIDFQLNEVPDPTMFGANTGEAFPGAPGTMAALKIEYLRGDQTYEALGDYDGDTTTPQTRLFRERETPLGDIVNSRPIYVKNFNYGYIDASYGNYLASQENRDAMIYVGANDGMLHAFEDEGDSVNEKFAFIPGTVLNALPGLADDSFNANHTFFVDGTMTAIDAKLDGDWATVLGSPLGRGFKGLFLLDITDPDTNNDDDLFRWEINEQTLDSSNNPVYSKMGYMLTTPKIARFQIPDGTSGYHDKWVMIAGNGVHSEDADDLDSDGNPVKGKASVYIIDLDNGELITEIVLDNGYENQNNSTGVPAYEKLTEGNGITSVAAVDLSQNSYVDRLYAADLKGGIYRINYDYNQSDNPSDDNGYLASKLASAFVDSGNPAPIFKAEGPVRTDISDTSPSGPSIAQPITSDIAVTGAPDAFDDSDTVMLFFGTGQYFDLPHVLETENLKVQSMYGIVDSGGWDTGRNVIDKDDDLIEQGISETTNQRFISNATINYTGDTTGDLGWFIDLPSYGERMLLKPSALFGYISFFSQLPEGADVCALGVNGWAMLAKIDTATSVPTDSSGTIRPLGVKTNNPLPPITWEDDFGNIRTIESPDLPTDGSTGVTLNEIPPAIPKRYSRASWLRVQ